MLMFKRMVTRNISIIIIVVILILGVFGYIATWGFMPFWMSDPLVNYYGTIVPKSELRAQGVVYCQQLGSFSFPGEPAFTCFDTKRELDDFAAQP